MTSDSGTKPQPFNWTNPLDRITWQQAFKARAPKMKLRDGNTYTIEYEPGVDRDGTKVTKAWVKKDGSTTPCGWFTVEKVLAPGWVSSNA
jgi:hypothetical protein